MERCPYGRLPTHMFTPLFTETSVLGRAHGASMAFGQNHVPIRVDRIDRATHEEHRRMHSHLGGRGARGNEGRGGARPVVSRCMQKGGGDARAVVGTRMCASARRQSSWRSSGTSSGRSSGRSHLGRAAPLGPMTLDQPDAFIRDALRREPNCRQVAREWSVCMPIRASQNTGTCFEERAQ